MDKPSDLDDRTGCHRVSLTRLLNTHLRDNTRFLHGDDGPTTILDALVVGNGNLAGSYLRVPAMTTAALPAAPAAGMEAYDTTIAGPKDYVGGFGALWSPRMQLLKQAKGTSTATVASDLSTIAMASSLLAGDAMAVFVTWEQDTANGSGWDVRNTTDSQVLFTAGSTHTAGDYSAGLGLCTQSNRGSTTVIAERLLRGSGAIGDGSGVAKVTFTTAWTGAWTLALHGLGQTGANNIYWAWQVWRLPAA